MANVLVFDASENINKVNSCRYALLKYLGVYNLKPPPGIEVYVYTDQPAYFEAFIPFFSKFCIKEISRTQIREWKGPDNFSQRVKIEIMREIFDNVSGNLLFLDRDTYITGPVEPVFEALGPES